MTPSASAFCCASAPAKVIGLMAPAKVKGVTMTHWPKRAMVMSPSSMGRRSQRRVGVDDTGQPRLAPHFRLVEAAAEPADLESVDDPLGTDAARPPDLVRQGRVQIVAVEMSRGDGDIDRGDGKSHQPMQDIEALGQLDEIAEVHAVRAGGPGRGRHNWAGLDVRMKLMLFSPMRRSWAGFRHGA